MRKSAILRIRIITGVVLFLSLVLIARLYQIQIQLHQDYIDKANKQYVHTVHDLYSRGSIFFTTKDGEEVSAATIQSGYLMTIDPSRITDDEDTYAKLNAIYPLDKQDFMAKASNKSRSYAELATQLTNDQANAVTALGLKGVQLYRNQWRYYPGNDLLARTIGFVGYAADSGDLLNGRYGLERYYDDTLTRDDGRVTVNFFAEIFSNLGNVIFDNTKSRTGDIVTTLEPTVSRMLDTELQQTQAQYHSQITGGIIMNPQTGEIYAMDAVPTFNLNDRTGVPIDTFANPLVENVYEMGSIMKALTMATGLDTGAVTSNTTYNDTGCITVNGSKICNYDLRARGVIPMQQVLNQSLNVGAAYVEHQIGNKRFSDYFKALGLGVRTGIDLPNEGSGLIVNLDSPRDVEHATASFGQGIAVTPIEMARALASLGNGGRLVTPHVVKRIDYQDGTFKDIAYPKGTQVFSTTTSDEISRMLSIVADTALGNGKYKMDHYTFATKTGTAQISDPKTGKYYPDQYLHSFFGYFPAYDPKFLIFLYTVKPQGVQYASETLTEPYVNIMKFIINYYNLPPDR